MRGKITDKDKKLVLYTADNVHILNTHETEHETERYWTTIYRKHQNEIDKVWNKERKYVYQELIEKEMKEQGHAIHGNTTFPMVLREHLDSDIYIERKSVPINYSIIKKNKELIKHLKMVKKNKATGLDNINGELYRALGEMMRN